MDNLLSETMTSVNSHFAVATEEEILQMFAFLECVYANTVILFNLHGAGFYNILSLF